MIRTLIKDTLNSVGKDVLLYGLVRDKQGLKISKSKGNVINPLEMTNKYGADALRMALIWGTLVENDISLSEDNIRGQRNFANKLWNISRFVLTNKPKSSSSRRRGSIQNNLDIDSGSLAGMTTKPRAAHHDDKWILTELTKTTKKITKLLDKYRLNEAAEELYDFTWNRFASTYLEKTKSRKDESQKVLEYVLYQNLKLAHPFMPFVTESIWSLSFAQDSKDFLISSVWPARQSLRSRR